MKTLRTLSMILLVSVLSLVNIHAQIAGLTLPDPEAMSFEPLNFSTVEPEIEQLKTGIEFWKIPDHTLPLVTLIVDIDAGITSEPAGKFGVCQLTAETLVRGGTTNMSAEEFNRQAELLGLSFGSRSSQEFTQVSVSCLAKDLNVAMMMLMDLIKNPAFDEKEMELVRDGQIEQVKRMEKVPFFQAFNAMSKRLWGEDHPNARRPSAKELEALTKDDLVAFHKAKYHPNISRFAVIGAADDEACKLIKMKLKNWKGKAEGTAVLPQAAPMSEERTIILVDRPGTQAVVAMGHLSVGPKHPDRYTLEIFNEIYGGAGLSSRLMNQVRTQKGLAYVVMGAHMFQLPTGVFIAGCMTKNESVVEAITTIMDVTEQMQKEPVPEEELSSIVEAVENSFIFRFERPRRVLSRMLEYRRMGMPEDYLATYLEKIRAVTPEKIMKAAQDHVHLEKLQIVVAGPVEELKPQLETLGWPIEVVDND